MNWNKLKNEYPFSYPEIFSYSEVNKEMEDGFYFKLKTA